MTAGFAIEEGATPPVEGLDRVPVLRVRGEVDTTNAAAFESAVAARAGDGALVLDLTPVTYCDSAAFAALDRLLAGGLVAVAMAPDNPVRRAATVMGLPVQDSVEAAARAVGR